MPIYDYFCPQNGRVVEVHHRMDEKLKTWGEVCALAGIDPGETPLSAPVERLISAGHYLKKGCCRGREKRCCGGGCACGA